MTYAAIWDQRSFCLCLFGYKISEILQTIYQIVDVLTRRKLIILTKIIHLISVKVQTRLDHESQSAKLTHLQHMLLHCCPVLSPHRHHTSRFPSDRGRMLDIWGI